VRKLADGRSRIDAATRDPLVDDVDLLLVTDEQLLPRPVVHISDPATPAADLLERLRADADSVKGEGPWAERIDLLRELEGALKASNEKAITRVVRALLNHRSRYVLPVAQEAPHMVRFLRLFIDGSTPDPSLLRALLRDGLRGNRSQRVEGLQPLVLGKRDQMSRADFSRLAAEVSTLSQAAGVEHDDFDRLVARAPTPPVAIELPLDAPALVAGRYFAEPYEDSGARGVVVDIDALLAGVGAQMQAGGLLGTDDELRRVGELIGTQQVTGLILETHSPARAARRTTIQQRYRLKTALAVALVALAVAVMVLALVIYRREQRFLQSKSDFVATVSHELRTPLASMRVMAETLERRLAGNPDARDFPARMVGEVDRLTFLVDNILSFNRLDKGGFTLRPGVISLSEIAAQLRRDSAAFTRKPVEISVANEANFEADPDLVRLLFSNLLANACKYHERDRVELELAARDNVITVRDNGVGISPADRETVFVEFFRGGTRKGGFGLGLAICRRIMTLHLGSIRVADSGADGTLFELSFRSRSGMVTSEVSEA